MYEWKKILILGDICLYFLVVGEGFNGEGRFELLKVEGLLMGKD